MTELIDTHAHLDEFEELEPVLAKARDAGIKAIIAVGSGETSNQKILDICRNNPDFVFPSLGLHPWELGNLDDNQITHTIKSIEEKFQHITTIGEIGLDYDKRVLKRTSKEQQKEILQRLISIAKTYNKTISIHSRYAWEDCFNLVNDAGIKRAVFHWFTGFSSVLREIIDAGYYISCTPAAEYHEEHQRAIKSTPLELLLLETDCPVTYGRENRYRSQPSDTLRSLRAAALLKGTTEAIIAEQTTHNAIAAFNLRLENHHSG